MISCFFFKQKTANELRISDWSSDVCSSDLWCEDPPRQRQRWRDGGDQRSRRIGRGEDAAGDLRRTGTAVSADVPLVARNDLRAGSADDGVEIGRAHV